MGGWGSVRLIAELDTMIELLNCDCMEYMATLPDKYFDLAIVDPPYGISINMNMGRKKGEAKKHIEKKWDDLPPPNTYFNELQRISKNQIIWGGNYFALPLTKSWIFWDKEVPDGVSFADGELAWTSFDKTLVKAKIQYSGALGKDENRIHPTQKPVNLYKWLLANYAKKGQRVFDSHLGSASSAIAAHYFGVDFVGCELDKDYFEAAKARFDMATKQLAMSI